MKTEKFCTEFCQEFSKILEGRNGMFVGECKGGASGGDISAKMKAGSV